MVKVHWNGLPAPIPWELTDYYSRELGENLGRKFLGFERLIDPERLAGIKSFTNRLEGKFSEGGARRINLDPGYLDSAKLVLPTTKNRDHRIYIGQGIFAEVTLHFRSKGFLPGSGPAPITPHPNISPSSTKSAPSTGNRCPQKAGSESRKH